MLCGCCLCFDNINTDQLFDSLNSEFDVGSNAALQRKNVIAVSIVTLSRWILAIQLVMVVFIINMFVSLRCATLKTFPSFRPLSVHILYIPTHTCTCIFCILADI